MRKVVIGEEDALAADSQLGLKRAGHPQLVEHPADHGLTKHFPGLGIRLQDTGENTIELPKGFLEKHNVVEVLTGELALLEAKPDRIAGKIEIVLDARKPLFLGGCNQLAVTK